MIAARLLVDIVDGLNCVVADPPRIAWVLARSADGADFADAMHVAASHPAGGFVAFDRRLVRRMSADAPNRVALLEWQPAP